MERTVVRRPHIPLSAHYLKIFRSVCFSSHRLHVSCYHILTTHHNQPAAIQPICHCHLLGLFQGCKAFDTLLSKLAALDLPTPVYNWLVDFFESHSHHTVFNGDVSRTRSITASIIQGSSVGPAAYTVTAADLRPLNPGNTFFKFADDAYLVIPVTKVTSRLPRSTIL